MAYSIRRVDYFYTTVRDRPGEAYNLLAQMAEMGLNMVAFTALPVGPMYTQLTIFPEDTGRMVAAAQRAGMKIDGPHRAFLVQGDDELGALAEIHQGIAAIVVDDRIVGRELDRGVEIVNRLFRLLHAPLRNATIAIDAGLDELGNIGRA